MQLCMQTEIKVSNYMKVYCYMLCSYVNKLLFSDLNILEVSRSQIQNFYGSQFSCDSISFVVHWYFWIKNRHTTKLLLVVHLRVFEVRFMYLNLTFSIWENKRSNSELFSISRNFMSFYAKERSDSAPKCTRDVSSLWSKKKRVLLQYINLFHYNWRNC